MIKVLEESIQKLVRNRNKGEFEISSSCINEVRKMLFNNIDLFKKYKMAYEVEIYNNLRLLNNESEVLIKIIEDNDNEIINEKIFKHMVSEIADKNL
ncbi:MAG: hypothetical protein E7C49_19440 [Clostridium sp.]|nr:hypothetical protein [Clostridium sp.]